MFSVWSRLVDRDLPSEDKGTRKDAYQQRVKGKYIGENCWQLTVWQACEKMAGDFETMQIREKTDLLAIE